MRFSDMLKHQLPDLLFIRDLRFVAERAKYQPPFVRELVDLNSSQFAENHLAICIRIVSLWARAKLFLQYAHILLVGERGIEISINVNASDIHKGFLCPLVYFVFDESC